MTKNRRRKICPLPRTPRNRVLDDTLARGLQGPKRASRQLQEAGPSDRAQEGQGDEGCSPGDELKRRARGREESGVKAVILVVVNFTKIICSGSKLCPAPRRGMVASLTEYLLQPTRHLQSVLVNTARGGGSEGGALSPLRQVGRRPAQPVRSARNESWPEGR